MTYKENIPRLPDKPKEAGSAIEIWEDPIASFQNNGYAWITASRAIRSFGEIGKSHESIEITGSVNLYEATPKEAKQIAIRHGQLRIAMPAIDAAQTQITAPTHRLFTLFNAYATAAGYNYNKNEPLEVSSSLDEIMSLFGWTDKKEARKQLRKQMDVLSRTIWTLESDEKDNSFAEISFYGGAKGISNGKVFFSVSSYFMHYIFNPARRDNSTLSIPAAMLKVNMNDNPHTWAIVWCLANHSNNNLGLANETTLKVSTLLDHVPEIPKPEAVKRKETERIVARLERDLNAAVEIGALVYWDYCHKNKEPLTDSEQTARLDKNGNEKPMPWAIAKDLLLTWELPETDRDKRLAAKGQRAIAAKQENAARERRIKRKAETEIAKAMAAKRLASEQQNSLPLD